jgi:hypothetical protein
MVADLPIELIKMPEKIVEHNPYTRLAHLAHINHAFLPISALALGLFAQAAPTDIICTPGSETCGNPTNSRVLAAGLSLSDLIGILPNSADPQIFKVKGLDAAV